MPFKPQLFRKTAADWDADSTRYNRREDTSAAKGVAFGLSQRFHQLMNGLYAQPGGQGNVTLGQFLRTNPITQLFQSTDNSVRLMGYKLRSDLSAYLKENFTEDQIKRFQAQYGNNVTDWFVHKIISRKAMLFVRAKGTYRMDLDEAIAEHKDLVKVLKSPSRADDRQEAKEQGGELKAMERGKSAARKSFIKPFARK